MAKSGNYGFYILKILEKHASEKNRLSQKQIMDYLFSDYGLSISRNTLSLNINFLKDNGLISGERKVYKLNIFSDYEISLLMDGIFYGKHVPAEDAKIIINKLKSMSYKNLKNRLSSAVYVQDIIRTDNEKLFVILNSLEEAIKRNKKVRITMCEYDGDGELRDRVSRVVNPYYIAVSNSRYYLVCFNEERAKQDDAMELENRRLDRISKVEILEENRVSINTLPQYKNSFSMSQYINEHIYMFRGKTERIKMRIKKKNIGDFIDWFGKDYLITDDIEEDYIISFKAVSAAVLFWALQYGKYVTILEPDSLRNEIKNEAKRLLEKYE